MSARLTVMIVDDHPVVRKGIAALLAAEPDLAVVAEAASVAEARKLYAEHAPDVTIVDLRLPDGSGAALIAALRGAPGNGRFLVLTTYDGDEDIHRALEAGAQGYLLKDTFCDEILDAVRSVSRGGRVVPAAVARRLDERLPGSDLSAREREVLRAIARGLTNKEIAAEFGIGEATVKTHVINILGKLGVDDRTAAAILALRRGIITL